MTTTQPAGRGRFIVFEGGDGAGKSTQIKMLGSWLAEKGHEVVLTREPGGTDLGVHLREALLHGGHVDARTEALLFATDRAHHVASLIRPALARGAVVVSDRFMDSSIAYQGAARQLGEGEIRDLSMWGTHGLLPDLTVVLDLSPDAAAARRGATADRMERESVAFHQRVRESFLGLAAAAPERYIVLDATKPIGELHEHVTSRVGALLQAAT